MLSTKCTVLKVSKVKLHIVIKFYPCDWSIKFKYFCAILVCPVSLKACWVGTSFNYLICRCLHGWYSFGGFFWAFYREFPIWGPLVEAWGKGCPSTSMGPFLRTLPGEFRKHRCFKLQLLKPTGCVQSLRLWKFPSRYLRWGVSNVT